MSVVCKNSMCVHVCALVDVCVHLWVCVCAFVDVCVHLWVCVCAFVDVCVFINTYLPPTNSLTKRTGVGGGGYPVRREDTKI